MVMCTISLENNNLYCAGQLLKGSIELFLDEAKKLRGLYFLVHGAAKCHWTESKTKTTGFGENRRTITTTTHFKGKDVYLNTKSYLVGSEDGDTIEISKGTHYFDFSCQLPDNLPASFEANFGHVRYRVEAVLDIPTSANVEFKLQFAVFRHEDLNDFPELRTICSNDKIKNFHWLLCQSAPLMINVSLPQAGFVPGQTIPITISYVNKTSVDVLKLKINLKRIIGSYSQTPRVESKFETDDIVEIFAEGVKRSTAFKKVEKDLVLPKVMLKSNRRCCECVKIFYELKVEALLSMRAGYRQSVKMFFPIVIGSIPINNERPKTIDLRKSTPVREPSVISSRSNRSIPSVAPLLESPPPTFDEAVMMKKEKQVETKEDPNDPLLA